MRNGDLTYDDFLQMVMFLITLRPVMASEIMHDLGNHHGTC